MGRAEGAGALEPGGPWSQEDQAWGWGLWQGAGPGLPCSDPRGGEEENVLLDTLGPLLGPREG